MSTGFRELRELVPHAEVSVPSVSKWTVGMHVHHCCLGASGTCEVLRNSTRPAPPQGRSLSRFFVMTFGRIPRGAGKSPESVIPAPNVSIEELMLLLDAAESAAKDASTLEPDAWFRHGVFGVLRRDEALRFVGIHNRHHARIARDILKRS